MIIRGAKPARQFKKIVPVEGNKSMMGMIQNIDKAGDLMGSGGGPL